MLSKKQVIRIISLQRKKTRDEERLFVVEGDKIVREFLTSGMKVEMLIAKREFISGLSADLVASAGEVYPVSYE